MAHAVKYEDLNLTGSRLGKAREPECKRPNSHGESPRGSEWLPAGGATCRPERTAFSSPAYTAVSTRTKPGAGHSSLQINPSVTVIFKHGPLRRNG